MKIWIASMECAGIAEAGGVKNVTFSLCKEFALLNNSLTLFIPVYKCTSYDLIQNLENKFLNLEIDLCNKKEKISFSRAFCSEGNFQIIFIHHPLFEEKEAVYTYTENEEKLNPNHKKGTGHEEVLFLNSLFAKAICEYGNFIDKESLPDIIHCQDASTALIPVFCNQNSLYKNAKKIVTIHNAGPSYHHNFLNIEQAKFYTGLSENFLCGGLNNFKVEPFLLALNSGAFLTTVSKDYVFELVDKNNKITTEGLSEIFCERGIKIKGITNGIDYSRYNPTDTKISELPFAFNPEKKDLKGKYLCRDYFLKNFINKEIPDIKIFGSLYDSITNFNTNDYIYFSYHGRITSQKGISVLIAAIPEILKLNEKIKFIITGQGEAELEDKLKNLTYQFKNRILFLNGYEKETARLTTVCGDFIILPSFFEPCGLEDFIAQIYGTIPIAHKTGGLNKIIDGETGFLYAQNTPENLVEKVKEALSTQENNSAKFFDLIKHGAIHVHKKYLWSNVIKNEYLPFFKEILKKNDFTY